MPSSFMVLGTPDDGFTSAEPVVDGEMIGRIFELEDGMSTSASLNGNDCLTTRERFGAMNLRPPLEFFGK